ncbi:MAG TPA: hypothetical protein PLG50_14485 [bacterium]|nr:hypothetical protein [bacterium]HQG46863.1 hypothetical protein [bacterium]HQI48248.1 hypothetical protein [bacterium]HQJ65088.1 hypothetical protein [bacterium]
MICQRITSIYDLWLRRGLVLVLVAAGLGIACREAAAQTATLSWQAVMEDTAGHAEVQPVYYNIYCDTVPAFRPGPANFLAATLNTSYVHRDARLNDPNRHLFYLVRAVDVWGNESAVSDTVGEVPYILVRARAFLQGAYDAAGDTMRTTLQRKGLLPLTSPYIRAPRAVAALPAGTVDWVLLQLRDPGSANIIGEESFLINQAGYLTELDGVNQALGMAGCAPGNYQLVLYQRNHAAVMSRDTFYCSKSAPVLHDFSADSTFYEGRNAACPLEPAVWGLWSGDVNQDHQISDLDFGSWQSAAKEGRSGYQPQDLNFDGQVTSQDYILWYRAQRIGATSYVP